MKDCRGCGVGKESRAYGRIWLSDDGYCSVCNAKYKDRPRIKPIFEFTTKDIEYKDFDSAGNKLTEHRKLKHKVEKKYNANAAPSITRQILEKRKKRITEFL